MLLERPEAVEKKAVLLVTESRVPNTELVADDKIACVDFRQLIHYIGELNHKLHWAAERLNPENKTLRFKKKSATQKCEKTRLCHGDCEWLR